MPITKPRAYNIGRSAKTKKLYDLEEQRSQAIQKCAREWLVVVDKPSSDFWSVAIPQVLFDTLESFVGGLEAAQAYVEYKTHRSAENG